MKLIGVALMLSLLLATLKDCKVQHIKKIRNGSLQCQRMEGKGDRNEACLSFRDNNPSTGCQLVKSSCNSRPSLPRQLSYEMYYNISERKVNIKFFWEKERYGQAKAYLFQLVQKHPVLHGIDKCTKLPSHEAREVVVKQIELGSFYSIEIKALPSYVNNGVHCDVEVPDDCTILRSMNESLPWYCKPVDHINGSCINNRLDIYWKGEVPDTQHPLMWRLHIGTIKKDGLCHSKLKDIKLLDRNITQFVAENVTRKTLCARVHLYDHENYRITPTGKVLSLICKNIPVTKKSSLRQAKTIFQEKGPVLSGIFTGALCVAAMVLIISIIGITKLYLMVSRIKRKSGFRFWHGFGSSQTGSSLSTYAIQNAREDLPEENV